MAVLKEWRGRGVGTALLKYLLREAERRLLVVVIINSQSYAIGFYARIGFQLEGKEFIDAGIPHVRMVLNLCKQTG